MTPRALTPRDITQCEGCDATHMATLAVCPQCGYDRAQAATEQAEEAAEYEEDLQEHCEQALRDEGFLPSTGAMVQTGIIPRRGVYVHLHNCQGNPYMVDLYIFHHDGAFLAVELKSAGGAVTPEQRWLLKAHGGATVRRRRGFRNVLTRWLRDVEADQ